MWLQPLTRRLPDLKNQAKQFAGEMSALLNGTVTDGIRLQAIRNRQGYAVLGYRVSSRNPRGDAVPLTCTRSPAMLSLRVLHSLGLDDNSRFLTTIRSSYTLLTADDDTRIATYDYVRTPPNCYPEAHPHIDGEAQGLQQLLNACGRIKSRAVDLHLPVGGRRYRPSLEDLIEFCILEDLVTPRPGWQDKLNASRNRFHIQQLKAAVRRNPQEAAETLRDDGWSVAEPSSR